jgi:hypothetical protein
LTDQLTHHRRSSEPNTGFRESQPDSYLNRVLQQPQQQTYYLLLEGDVPIFVEKGAAGIFGL